MFVTVTNKPTYVGNVNAGDTITNTGSDTVYLGRDPNTVGNAPTTGTPLFPSSAVQWREAARLWAMCPANSNPTIEIGSEGMIPFSGPFADGEQIVTTGLHSRNYVPGVSGWRIGANGSVEFNTMGGVIEENDLGFFFYYPIAGSGNLRFSVTDSDGTDPYGNTYKAGLFLNQRQGWFTGNNSHTVRVNPDGQIGPELLFAEAGHNFASHIQQITPGGGPPELRLEATSSSGAVAKLNMPAFATQNFYAPNSCGTLNVSFTALTSFTQTVTFANPFSTLPVVNTNIASGNGVAAHWNSRAINVSTTGFQLFVYADASGAAQTWTNIPVNWIAVGS